MAAGTESWLRVVVGDADAPIWRYHRGATRDVLAQMICAHFLGAFGVPGECARPPRRFWRVKCGGPT
jgi:hypothetical protein